MSTPWRSEAAWAYSSILPNWEMGTHTSPESIAQPGCDSFIESWASARADQRRSRSSGLVATRKSVQAWSSQISRRNSICSSTSVWLPWNSTNRVGATRSDSPCCSLVTWTVAGSNSSIADASSPNRTHSYTASAACSRASNTTTATPTCSGRPNSRRVISVTTPRVPSEPTMSPTRS